MILSELMILPDINEMKMLAGVQLFPDVGNVYFTDLWLRLLDKLQKCRTVLHSYLLRHPSPDGQSLLQQVPERKSEYEWTCQSVKTSGRLSGLEKEMEGR